MISDNKNTSIMEQAILTVEIFRTDVTSAVKAEECKKALSACFPGYRIDFDLEDRDKILRMEGGLPDVSVVIRVLAGLGVWGELFPDE